MVDPQDRMPFGRRLACWLDVLNVSRADLARAVRVTPPSVSDWLSGRTKPSGENLEKIITVGLGLSMTEFYGPIAVPDRLAADSPPGAAS